MNSKEIDWNKQKELIYYFDSILWLDIGLPGMNPLILRIEWINGNITLVRQTHKELEIDLGKELATYHLTGKWNDYVGVQKRVLSILKEESFFEESSIVNFNSGMEIKITAKGIKETLSKGNRFQNLPRKLKELKVATLRSIPILVQQGSLIADDVQNEHGENAFFAYIVHEIKIDGETYKVRISIKKKVSSNIFWMHNIDCNEKSLELLNLRS